MNKITIPPEAELAALRAYVKEAEANGKLGTCLRAACLAMLTAWPGQDTCTKITPDPTTRQWIVPQKCLRLPLKEMSDE